ncbi:hypothetical protein HanOQP8_Chr08g0284991 [Helianthus annuus]|nr:hypothetical protein HanOQP8_Chr08g0284991 [Helianthus annuus]
MRIFLFHRGFHFPRVFGTSTGIPFDLNNRHVLPSKLLHLSILNRQWFFFSTNFKFSSMCISVCGITSDSSAKHFFRLQMRNTLLYSAKFFRQV